MAGLQVNNSITVDYLSVTSITRHGRNPLSAAFLILMAIIWSVAGQAQTLFSLEILVLNWALI